MHVDAQTNSIIIEYFPANLAYLHLVCAMIAPNVVLVFADAFSHLRLQITQVVLLQAKAHILNCLSRPGNLLVPQTLIEQFEEQFEDQFEKQFERQFESAAGQSAGLSIGSNLQPTQPLVSLLAKHLALS